PENSWNLVKLLKDINEKNNTTIIMTTHNYEIVDSLNKRQIEIKDGQVQNQETKKTSEKNIHSKKHDRH
ncbi:MAG: hypothetical protein WCX33_02195, partial [Candidatus Shapirobacteria bacterium]